MWLGPEGAKDQAVKSFSGHRPSRSGTNTLCKEICSLLPSPSPQASGGWRMGPQANAQGSQKLEERKGSSHTLTLDLWPGNCERMRFCWQRSLWSL